MRGSVVSIWASAPGQLFNCAQPSFPGRATIRPHGHSRSASAVLGRSRQLPGAHGDYARRARRTSLSSALARAGATVVQALSHAFPGTGLTCVLILSESHAVLHTWPETGTVNIDIFSCSTRLKSLEAIDELRPRVRRAAACRSRRSLVPTDTAVAVRRARLVRAARRRLEPRPLRPAAPDLDRSARRCCRSPACRRGWRRRCFGASALPVEVTLACSGADALALCLGAILAYPGALANAPRRRGRRRGTDPRLNTLRIGTLGRAAASPAWFNALHVYVWPAVLTLAIAGYVFAWMRLADRRAGAGDRGRHPRPRLASPRRVRADRRGDSSSLTAGLLCSVHGRLAALSRERAACSRWPASSPARRPRDSSASSASARTPRPTCSGRRAAASWSRRSAFPRR